MTWSHLAYDVPRPPATAEIRVRVTALLACALWLEVLHDAAPAVGSMPAWLAALAGVGALLLCSACEAAVAAAAWWLQGKRVGPAALIPRLLVASSPETL